MKKYNSLAEQVAAAQRTVDQWPESQRASLQLEGFDTYLQQSESKNSHLSYNEELESAGTD